MAAVIDSATRFRRFVNGAEKLPLTGAHLGAGSGGTGGFIEQESDNEFIAFVDQKSAELIEP